jgi:hypothetical protein
MNVVAFIEDARLRPEVAAQGIDRSANIIGRISGKMM